MTLEIQKQKQAISGQHLLVGTLLGQCHGVQGCIEPVSEDRQLHCNGLHQQTGQSPIHCAVETGRELWVWALDHSLFLRALHVPGLDNRGTDLMPRVGPLSDKWRLHASVVALRQSRRTKEDSGSCTHCLLWFFLTQPDNPSSGWMSSHMHLGRKSPYMPFPHFTSFLLSWESEAGVAGSPGLSFGSMLRVVW